MARRSTSARLFSSAPSASTAAIWSGPNRSAPHRSAYAAAQPSWAAQRVLVQARRSRAAAPRRTRGSVSSIRNRAAPSASATTRAATARPAPRRGRPRRARARPRPSRGLKPSWKTDSQASARCCVGVEQVPRPVDHRGQRRCRSGADRSRLRSRREAVVEPAAHLLDRHRAHPGGGELDGQRQPVEPVDDVARPRRGRGRRRAGPPGPLGRTARHASSGRELAERRRPARRRCSSGARLVVSTRRSRVVTSRKRDQRGHRLERRARSCRAPAGSARCPALRRSGRARRPAGRA